MKLAVKMKPVGSKWAVEIPTLEIFTEGKSKKHAMKMAADAVESVVNTKGAHATCLEEADGSVTVSVSDTHALIVAILREQRAAKGVSLSAAAKQLEAKTKNAYARYERPGGASPSVEKFDALLKAIGVDIVLGV